jgi:hypothetical protein
MNLKNELPLIKRNGESILVTWSEIPRDPIFLDPISDISVVSNASAVLVP